MFKSKKRSQELAKRRESMLNKALPNPAYQSIAKGSGGSVPPVSPGRDWKKIAKKTAIVLGILLLIAGGWVGWKFVSNSAKIFGWDNLFGLFQHTKLKGEDEGRVNILLAGNSADDAGHGGAEAGTGEGLHGILSTTCGRRAG